TCARKKRRGSEFRAARKYECRRTSEARQFPQPKTRMNRKDANERSWATHPIEAIGSPSGVKRVDLRMRWLGRMDFADALVLQEELLVKKWTDRSLQDELVLLEHEPVYTIGRTPDRSSLLGAAHLPHPLFPINRGGQATYHGPGQLMGYPIVDLRRCGQDLHRYLRWLEQLLIELLAHYG